MERYLMAIFYIGVRPAESVSQEQVADALDRLQNGGKFSRLIESALPPGCSLESSAIDVVEYPDHTILQEDSDRVLDILRERTEIVAPPEVGEDGEELEEEEEV